MKKYLTPAEVAEILMVSPVTLRQWSQKGMLTFKTTAGGHRRYVAADVENFKNKYGVENSAIQGSPLRVLIVDDDDALREMLSITISNSIDDCEVDTASDGFTAGDKIHTFAPDIVLLDLMMPGIKGLEVCKAIKGNDKTRHIRVIAMTGYSTEQNINEILGAGAERCLTKPFGREELVSAITSEQAA